METAIGCLKHIFFLRGECQDLFSMCWLPHISFNFPVELSLLILCDCDTTFFLFFFQTLQTSLFLFSSYITLVLWTATSFCLFFWAELSLSGTVFVWMSHKYLVCLHYLWVNTTRASPFFFCSNVTKISMYLHYFYFVSFWVIVEPFSFLSYVDCYISFFFLQRKFQLSTLLW